MVFGVVIAAVAVAQVSERGAVNIVLEGGNKGDVNFPHRTHQDALVDCKICHDIFPQTPGVITDLKNKGRLEKKQVMNHCRGCHKNTIKSGKKAGPTICSKCHRK